MRKAPDHDRPKLSLMIFFLWCSASTTLRINYWECVLSSKNTHCLHANYQLVSHCSVGARSSNFKRLWCNWLYKIVWLGHKRCNLTPWGWPASQMKIAEALTSFRFGVIWINLWRPTLEIYWSTKEAVQTSIFRRTMSRYRFQLIHKLLWFNERKDLQSVNPDRLYKVKPIEPVQ